VRSNQILGIAMAMTILGVITISGVIRLHHVTLFLGILSILTGVLWSWVAWYVSDGRFVSR
jgi:hypothetical protein